MKDMVTATIIMAIIIVGQIALSSVFPYQVVETFSKAAFCTLFFHYAYASRKMKSRKMS